MCSDFLLENYIVQIIFSPNILSTYWEKIKNHFFLVYLQDDETKRQNKVYSHSGESLS
jgi:hypothetical protein